MALLGMLLASFMAVVSAQVLDPADDDVAVPGRLRGGRSVGHGEQSTVAIGGQVRYHPRPVGP